MQKKLVEFFFKANRYELRIDDTVAIFEAKERYNNVTNHIRKYWNNS